MEVVKMTTQHAAMKKDLDLVEQKLHNYVKIIKFEELCDEVKTLTPIVDHQNLVDKLDSTKKDILRYALQRDVNLRFQDLDEKVFVEINRKMNLKDYQLWHKEYSTEVAEELKQIQKDA